MQWSNFLHSAIMIPWSHISKQGLCYELDYRAVVPELIVSADLLSIRSVLPLPVNER